MLLDLSSVLSEQHKTLEKTVPCSLENFQSAHGIYPIMEKENVHVKMEYIEDGKYHLEGDGRFIIGIPCDRCLEIVPTEFRVRFDKEILLDSSEKNEGTNYIDGYTLDVDKLVCEEILIGWPTKILCSEDCKGLCSVCGQNLNQGTCNCEDTGLDPRMSVIRDVFKNFKEV